MKQNFCSGQDVLHNNSPLSTDKKGGLLGAPQFHVRCRLSRKQHFNWALTGPVIVILAVDCVQDCGPVRLGCTWMLGLYQSNLCFRVLVIILNSQQGTFLFIVHCALNKEV
ncbi:hypothetical protein OYC64_006287 [Pagothenia borchgrevinki]|uniref:Uncharacterized protein n=1 Tax=Pagothenia borchgrevinki TaxID=8213 RepID=A0ABD2GIP0_PAGBO